MCGYLLCCRDKVLVDKLEFSKNFKPIITPRSFRFLTQALLDCTKSVPEAELMLCARPHRSQRINFRPIFVRKRELWVDTAPLQLVKKLPKIEFFGTRSRIWTCLNETIG